MRIADHQSLTVHGWTLGVATNVEPPIITFNYQRPTSAKYYAQTRHEKRPIPSFAGNERMALEMRRRSKSVRLQSATIVLLEARFCL